jgi:class 3 adenylate cyclase
MDRTISDATIAVINHEVIDDAFRRRPMRFATALEAAFQRAYAQQSLLVNRLSIAGGTLLLASFGFLDPYIFPETYRMIWAIRFGLLVPLATTVCLLSFAPWYPRLMQRLTAFMMVVVIVGILIMAAMGGRNELGTSLYLFGVLPVMTFLFGASRLQFRWALAVALICFAAFEFIVFRPGGLYATGALQTETVIAANFFIVAEIAIGAMANFFFERSTRLNFVQQLLIERERSKSDDLLYNMLPPPIAERLKRHELIADKVDQASVCFADFTNFTRLSSTLSPSEVLAMLDQAFTRFDHISQRYGAEKIKTIGDSYMVAVGVPTARKDHAEIMARMALDMRDAFLMLPITKKYALNIRIGFSSGPLVAGVLGSKKQIYDLWGDTVNTASRMESNGIAGEIQLSHYAYELIKDKFVFESRGEIPIKGKGEMLVYLLKSRVT